MTIVVTGATGNVGRPLVAELAAAGAHVRAVSRQRDAADFPTGVEVVGSAAEAIPGASAVFLNSRALAGQLDGYSAADCVALLREAALTAMRRSIDAADVTAADVVKARESVRPSLDPAQVESLRAFSASR